MTNKNFSMVDGKRIGIASNLTPRLHRVDSLSILSRQSLLPILLLCLTLFIGVGNAWGADFELYSGSITEGDYLIVYNNAAMNTTVDGDRLQYENVSPNNNVISTTSTAIVWHIATSGNYWTIYNAAANKYAASTGAKNKAQMLASGTDDMSLWTVSGTSTYEFVNKKNTTNNVNKNLRKNGSYGFACYATSTGGALSLYKLKNSTPATPYTVTLMDDQAHPLTEESAGDGVELPERAGCEGYTFIGWTASWTEEQDEWTITAPEIIEVGDYVPSADINLYPVYKKIVEGGSSTSTFTSNAQGYSNDTQASAKTVQNVTYTWGSGAKYFTSGSSVRMYADNTLTISSSNSITQVDFTYSQGAFSTSGTVTTGSMTSNSRWQGSAKSIKFTNSTGSQVRISQIVVTYIGGSTTYYISVPNCCQSLGSINGSVLRTHF